MLAKLRSALPAIGRKARSRSDDAEFAARVAEDAPPADCPRLRALETLWGVGRFTAGSGLLDDHLLDKLGPTPETPPRIGMLGTDPALALAARNRFGAPVVVAEWRRACAARGRILVPDLPTTACELDRPHGLGNQDLTGLISQDAMAFADHKSGLAAQIHRLLQPGGTWVLLDTVCGSDGFPEAAFASAWAEPQPPGEELLATMLGAAGFEIVDREDPESLWLGAVRKGFRRLADLAPDLRQRRSSAETALTMREIAWEAASWKTRIDAWRKRDLSPVLWTIRKPGDAAAAETDAEPEPEPAEE